MICCTEVKERFSLNVACCGSCHEDEEDYGYELLEFTIDGEYGLVCCRVHTALDEKGILDE